MGYHNLMKKINARWCALLLLLAAVGAVLGMGAQRQQRAFLTRGISTAMPEPTVGAGVRLGLNVALTPDDAAALAAQLAEIKGLGVNHVKQSFYFTSPFDWAASDRLLQAVQDAGLTLTPLLDGDPAANFAPPPDPAAFAAWASAFAARYGDQIDAYIIWDEPNLTSHWGGQPVNPAAYAALLSAAAAGIRQADANALIVAAPLAPTIETGPLNLADPLYLQLLYEEGAAGAFDIVAAKPYGFNSEPDDRLVDIQAMNFNRVILLREVMERNGDSGKAIWAGNWGWNSLPPGWAGAPSIWGQVTAAEQADWTTAALFRARQEWPWMGLMFLENWQPDLPPLDAHWGFSIAGRPVADALRAYQETGLHYAAYPGFHLAQAGAPNQQYQGDWRFSPEFGADAPNTGETANPAENAVTFYFWGSDVALRVRRADYRARFFVTIDGAPANALPRDENGQATLVLTAADPAADYVANEIVARNLRPGPHTLRLEPYRGWDQWALQGFSVLYHPPDAFYRLKQWGLAALAALALAGAGYFGRRADWGIWGSRLRQRWQQWGQRGQLWLTGFVAALVGLSGWLTWGEQGAGIYRRLGDLPQLVLTAAAASTFYVAPSFLIYLAALTALFLLITLRPAWGLALIAFTLPWAVQPKAMLGYRFSPVEIFILVTLAAHLTARALRVVAHYRENRRLPAPPRLSSFNLADAAVLALTLAATGSLYFTERLDVAWNEWRLVIVEPALFYLMLRWTRLEQRELWVLVDAFVLGGVVIALIGLGQYVTGVNLITAEGGVLRLRATYGSPNNVALYLGRIWPLLLAMALWGTRAWQAGSWRQRLAQDPRRWLYALGLLPAGLAWLLTFSKGGLFLGMPAALLVIFVLWQRRRHRRAWPWVLAAALLAGIALLITLQMPALAARLNPQGETGFLRLNLWRASLNMARDHLWTGVGLDNFLYQYRGRYIFDAAWREPNLNHPHNILLDFATRLGLPGVIAGTALFYACWRALHRRLHGGVSRPWQPVLVGFGAALAYTLAHGVVDHSFFLVDLAGAFYFMLALAGQLPPATPEPSRPP